MSASETTVAETVQDKEEQEGQQAPVETTVESTTEDSGTDWEDLMLDEEDEEEVGEVAAKSEESPAVSTEPPKEEVQAAPAEGKQEEVAPPVEPPTAEEPAVETVEETPAPAEEVKKTQTAEEIAEMRSKAVGELSTHYALSEDDAERLRENPHEVLPELAANLYLDLYESMMNGIAAQLPQMINSVQMQERAVSSAADQFYGEWKQLDNEQGKQQVERLGRAYRTANPNATLQEFIRDVGIQASVALKLPLPGYETGGTPEPSPPSIPSAPPAASTQPHPRTAGASNPFEAMAEEFLEEER